jgi:hypothetical protein
MNWSHYGMEFNIDEGCIVHEETIALPIGSDIFNIRAARALIQINHLLPAKAHPEVSIRTRIPSILDQSLVTKSLLSDLSQIYNYKVVAQDNGRSGIEISRFNIELPGAKRSLDPEASLIFTDIILNLPKDETVDLDVLLNSGKIVAHNFKGRFNVLGNGIHMYNFYPECLLNFVANAGRANVLCAKLYEGPNRIIFRKEGIINFSSITKPLGIKIHHPNPTTGIFMVPNRYKVLQSNSEKSQLLEVEYPPFFPGEEDSFADSIGELNELDVVFCASPDKIVSSNILLEAHKQSMIYLLDT